MKPRATNGDNGCRRFAANVARRRLSLLAHTVLCREHVETIDDLSMIHGGLRPDPGFEPPAPSPFPVAPPPRGWPFDPEPQIFPGSPRPRPPSFPTLPHWDQRGLELVGKK
jgi:hypothetical protein